MNKVGEWSKDDNYTVGMIDIIASLIYESL